jgi:hypothetical protein
MDYKKICFFKSLVKDFTDEELIMIGMKEIVQSAIERKIFDKLNLAIKEVGK